MVDGRTELLLQEEKRMTFCFYCFRQSARAVGVSSSLSPIRSLSVAIRLLALPMEVGAWRAAATDPTAAEQSRNRRDI